MYHFHDPELLLAALLLSLRGKKVVRDVREDLPRQMLDKHYLPLWIRTVLGGLMERFENFSARRLSAIVAATPVIAARFEGANSRTVLVRNFPALSDVPHERLPPWEYRSNSVAYVGAITAARGLRELVAAMSLWDRRPDVRLKLAGEFSPPGLLDEVKTHPGWQRVDYLGRLERKQVFEVLLQVRIGVMVLHLTPHIRASWPVKLFEYMLAGLPVVASGISLCQQVIKNTGCGIIVSSEAPREIAEALEYLLANPGEAEAMGQRGRHMIEELYNWQSEERKLVELYRDMAGLSSRHAPLRVPTQLAQ